MEAEPTPAMHGHAQRLRVPETEEKRLRPGRPNTLLERLRRTVGLGPRRRRCRLRSRSPGTAAAGAEGRAGGTAAGAGIRRRVLAAAVAEASASAAAAEPPLQVRRWRRRANRSLSVGSTTGPAALADAPSLIGHGIGDHSPFTATVTSARHLCKLRPDRPQRLLRRYLAALDQGAVLGLAPMRLHVTVAIGVEDAQLDRVHADGFGNPSIWHSIA